MTEHLTDEYLDEVPPHLDLVCYLCFVPLRIIRQLTRREALDGEKAEYECDECGYKMSVGFDFTKRKRR